ncbi:MAG TPA: hypothetical protein VHR45_14500 [Thermoanaerobaculia bacterium]|nr:hypothetical protein [Thermoanaerobaculia bacterium]
MGKKISRQLFAVDGNIRYVAVNQAGRIVEMEQNPRWPSYNPATTDEMEELIVNPVVLELARRRGDLDLEGIRYVVLRYGLQYQLVVPYRQGHVSIGVELEADVIAVAAKVLGSLGLDKKGPRRATQASGGRGAPARNRGE